MAQLYPEEMIQGLREEQAWIAGFAQFQSSTAMGPLGVELVSIDDDHASLEFEITNNARQPMGLLHGGVSMLVAETAASFHSSWLADLTKEAPVGIEISGSHLSSATKGRVRVTATVLRRARTHVFHEFEVVHLDRDRVLCRGRVTNYLKPFSP